MKYLLAALLTISIHLSISAAQTTIYTATDIDIFNDYVSKFAEKKDMDAGKLIVETGKYFEGTPYVNFTLEVSDPEALVVNFRELDCVTFVETVVALSQTIKSGQSSFEAYCENLRNIRFREGRLENFTSRLHYFSDWIYDNQAMGTVSDITKQLGGQTYAPSPKIMSKYPHKYPQLVANPEFIPVLSAIEDSIAARKLYSIPRTMTATIDTRLEDGYIIGTTTNTTMDVSHCGFVCIIDGKSHFMHASSKEKKIVITPATLSEYLKSVRTTAGIMVAKVCY